MGVTVGALYKLKGGRFWDFLQAGLERIPHLVYVVVGGDDALDELRQQAGRSTLWRSGPAPGRPLRYGEHPQGGGCRRLFGARSSRGPARPIVSLSGRLTAEEKIITDDLPGLDFVAQEWECLVDVLARLVDPEAQRMASERSRLHFLEKQHAAVVMRCFEELLLQVHTP